MSIVDTSQRAKPRFVARQYPMLSTLVIVFYVFAGLAVLSGLVSLAAIAAFAQKVPPELRESMALVLAFYGGVSVLAHAGWCAWSLVVAEIIKLMLDIQRNTQETAFYGKHGS